MFFLSFQEFLTYPLVYISSSDHLSPEVNKVQLQKVQKNLSFSLQVSSRFSSFILSPWPHCQFSCILPGPTSSSSSWHCGAVSQLSLTSRLPPTAPARCCWPSFFHDAHRRGLLAQQRSYEQLGTAAPQVPVWSWRSCPTLGCVAFLFSIVSRGVVRCDGWRQLAVVFAPQRGQGNCMQSSS